MYDGLSPLNVAEIEGPDVRYEQDGVIHDDAAQQDDANVGASVKGAACQQMGGNDANHGERYAEQDQKWEPKGFKERSGHHENEKQRKRDDSL